VHFFVRPKAKSSKTRQRTTPFLYNMFRKIKRTRVGKTNDHLPMNKPAAIPSRATIDIFTCALPHLILCLILLFAWLLWLSREA
jgi:hypothetical protein